MYKYIKSNQINESRFIDITVKCDNLFVRKVAAAKVTVVPNQTIDPVKKVFYEDFLTTVENLIAQRFNILSSKQSNRSYSWYIEFETNNIHWTVRIKISEHDKNEYEDDFTASSVNKKRQTAFRSILIGKDKEFKSLFDALNALVEIVDGIYEGNLDIINTDYRDRNFEEDEIQNTLDNLHIDRNFRLTNWYYEYFDDLSDEQSVKQYSVENLTSYKHIKWLIANNRYRDKLANTDYGLLELVTDGTREFLCYISNDKLYEVSENDILLIT